MFFCKRFGEAVRTERQNQGLSQEVLAELSGLHRTYISGVELGKRNPSLVNIVRIAQALGVAPAELLSNIAGDSQS